METTEEVNKNVKTKANSETNKPERNESETEREINDNAVLAHPSLLPPNKPPTPPPQLPQNKPVCEQPETTHGTKRSPVSIETNCVLSE